MVPNPGKGRVSSIGYFSLVAVGGTSVVEIGDSNAITPVSHTIAVQREKAHFFPYVEFLFRDYSIFFRPVTLPATEPVQVTTINECSVIEVQSFDLFRTLSSSVVHFGSSEILMGDSRIKHVRHLLRERPESL
ncbi:spore germination protein GerPE [Cohnella sp. AR92]|uniref:spore germination protein GerPE n=1 Tax=Cohnella sp. AR92 TaxID=648716 RepID=UPI000F8E1744|nr:spore germination protein GerPE [Cohnella sp. AR92]